MKILKYGNEKADNVLIQMVGDHDRPLLEAEAVEIAGKTDVPFSLLALNTDSWNNDLSPWSAPAVFGNERFGGGAEDTLGSVLELCSDRTKRYHIGGYSLAGLFALWCGFQTDIFTSVAAASPSLWFPGFTGYMRNNTIKAHSVYLSLGNKESKTRNRTMAAVEERIIESRDIILSQGADCFLEFNEGGHFQEPERRTARAFAYLLNCSR